ncbi:MAG TPA: TlyA family RNA methyltransferase [Anaerolineae bacterium]|nr:TlyA family RNA methyltransferase [Anaerolineae bacterium]
MSRVRLDQLLVERGLVESRERGQRLIMAGEVLVNDQVADKPGMSIAPDAAIRIKEQLPFVSRGGFKLAAALDRFPVPVERAVCADVGASTGGFTDCLLQRGAGKVYAIDVGYGQLAWKLRGDPRVVVLDRTNARYLEALPETIDICTIDAAFISLRLILPAVAKWLKPDAHIIALIKPQFEAGRDRVGKGGVVRDPVVHAGILRSILDYAREINLAPIDLIQSPIEGPAGNIEFLAWLRNAPLIEARPIDQLINSVGLNSIRGNEV